VTNDEFTTQISAALDEILLPHYPRLPGIVKHAYGIGTEMLNWPEVGKITPPVKGKKNGLSGDRIKQMHSKALRVLCSVKNSGNTTLSHLLHEHLEFAQNPPLWAWVLAKAVFLVRNGKSKEILSRAPKIARRRNPLRYEVA
jgi:hypothetical protein